MDEQKKPCNHMNLNSKTKKCEDCDEQIYPVPEQADAE